jgi:hypothetical protein
MGFLEIRITVVFGVPNHEALVPAASPGLGGGTRVVILLTFARRRHTDAAAPSIAARTAFRRVALEYGFITIGSRACSRSASVSAAPVT